MAKKLDFSSNNFKVDPASVYRVSTWEYAKENIPFKTSIIMDTSFDIAPLVPYLVGQQQPAITKFKKMFSKMAPFAGQQQQLLKRLKLSAEFDKVFRLKTLKRVVNWSHRDTAHRWVEIDDVGVRNQFIESSRRYAHNKRASDPDCLVAIKHDSLLSNIPPVLYFKEILPIPLSPEIALMLMWDTSLCSQSVFTVGNRTPKFEKIESFWEPPRVTVDICRLKSGKYSKDSADGSSSLVSGYPLEVRVGTSEVLVDRLLKILSERHETLFEVHQREHAAILTRLDELEHLFNLDYALMGFLEV